MDFSWILIFAGAAALFAFIFYNSINARMEAMEAKIKNLSAVIKQLESEGTITEPAINDKLRRLVKDGKTVEAIKEARKAFGLSLLEAKRYVDAL